MSIGYWGPIVPQKINGMCDILQLFKNLLNFAFTVSVPIAVAVLVYGGYRIIIGGGSPDGLKAGQEAVKAAVIGIVIVFGAWIFMNTVLNIVGLSLGGSSMAPWASACS